MQRICIPLLRILSAVSLNFNIDYNIKQDSKAICFASNYYLLVDLQSCFITVSVAVDPVPIPIRPQCPGWENSLWMKRQCQDTSYPHITHSFTPRGNLPTYSGKKLENPVETHTNPGKTCESLHTQQPELSRRKDNLSILTRIDIFALISSSLTLRSFPIVTAVSAPVSVSTLNDVNES